MKEIEIKFSDVEDVGTSMNHKEVEVLSNKIADFIIEIQITSIDFFINVIKPYASEFNCSDTNFSEMVYFNATGIYGILYNIYSNNFILKIDINVLRKALRNILEDFKKLSSTALNFISVTNFVKSDNINKCNSILEKEFNSFEKNYEEINSILKEKEKLLDNLDT